MAKGAQKPRAGGGDGGSARKAFLLRLPPALLVQLKALAAQELRSVNGQIEFLLREALERRGRRGG